jgi:hypothetical protein
MKASAGRNEAGPRIKKTHKKKEVIKRIKKKMRKGQREQRDRKTMK